MLIFSNSYLEVATLLFGTYLRKDTMSYHLCPESKPKKLSKYFITGATGTVGSQVINALEAQGIQAYTAANRHPKGDHAVAFDFADAATYDRADGHEAVFLLGPPLAPNLFELLEPFVDHLIANDRPRVVYLSAYGTEAMPELPFHIQMEEKLAASGLDYAVLRPGFFATNFGIYERENIEQRGIIFNPAGAGATPFIDPQDIGACAATLLTQEGGAAGRTYQLTGPTAYTMHQAASIVSELTGKQIVYPEPSNEAYRGALKESGAPDFIADYMIPVYNLIRNGTVADPQPDVKDLLGRQPTDLKEVLKRDFGS